MKIVQTVAGSLGDASYTVISDGVAAVVASLRDCMPSFGKQPALTICQSGQRAAMAASFLAAAGHAVQPLIDGGVDDVLALGRDVPIMNAQNVVRR